MRKSSLKNTRPFYHFNIQIYRRLKVLILERITGIPGSKFPAALLVQDLRVDSFVIHINRAIIHEKWVCLNTINKRKNLIGHTPPRLNLSEARSQTLTQCSRGNVLCFDYCIDCSLYFFTSILFDSLLFTPLSALVHYFWN